MIATSRSTQPLDAVLGDLRDSPASRAWADPAEVLDVLREQAPATGLADLLRDLGKDLYADSRWEPADQLRDAEQLLRQAAALLGEADHDQDGSPSRDSPHPADCIGGCGGEGVVLQTMTWDSQGDGIYVPVHQEEADCPGEGELPDHGECGYCGGTGFVYEPGYRHRCLVPQPGPAPDAEPGTDTLQTAGAADDRPL
jgi:hypothetical protein